MVNLRKKGGGLNLIPVKIEKAESLCYNIQLHWTLFLRYDVHVTDESLVNAVRRFSRLRRQLQKGRIKGVKEIQRKAKAQINCGFSDR